MTETATPVEIFCCYSHADETWLRKLESHLSLLKRQGLISLWHDRLIVPGADWSKAVDTQLETSSVILLLVSADFLASDYCYSVEMQRALERQEAGEARVVPILVRPVDLTGAPFAHLQVLPSDAKPVASWRSQDRALADVAAGIRRAIEDVPLLTASAPRAALPPIWNVPYPRNPFFLGRDDELGQVRQRLRAGQPMALSQPQAISGLGGIGKTQLALEYAYRYHQDYQTVLWTQAESTQALVSSYVAMATLLRLPESEAKEQEVIVQAVKAWLRTHRTWLLILDNADDLALLPDFLPSSPEGHILLTTRSAATGRLAYRMEIEPLSPEQGALFLLRRAGFVAPDADLSHISSQEREHTLQISQELGGLPLALDQAGAYLEETGTNLENYWQLYQLHRTSLLQERRGLVADHPAPVARTWSLSFQRIEERNPAAAELLRLLAFLAPDAIPEEILTAGASQLGPVLSPMVVDGLLLNQAIESLRAYSLIRRDPNGKALSVHRLVQAVLQDTVEEGTRRTWAERALLAVNATFPNVEQDSWPKCERLLPHVLLAAQYIERHQILCKEAARLFNEAASYLQDRARYAEAEPLFQRALRILEQQLGPEHNLVASALNNLANLYYDQGKFGEAKPLYLRVLQIWEEQLGYEHPDVADALNGLAELYRDQGKFAEAERLYLRALGILEQLGSERPDVAYPLNGLAELYYKQGRYTEAEPLFQRALRILEQQLGSERPDTVEIAYNLAKLWKAQNRGEEASLLYVRTLTVREQVFGAQHPKTTETRARLIALLHALGRHEEAAQFEAAQTES